MPDDPSDPPRKFYDFKDRDFERANPPRPPASGANAPGPELDPTKPIDVHELHRQAAVPGPVLKAGGLPRRENEIHAVLRENLARESAAGLNHLSPKPQRKRRRLRDYIILMVLNNSVFGALAIMGLQARNAVLFIYATAALGMIDAVATWIIWFVMDPY